MKRNIIFLLFIVTCCTTIKMKHQPDPTIRWEVCEKCGGTGFVTVINSSSKQYVGDNYIRYDDKFPKEYVPDKFLPDDDDDDYEIREKERAYNNYVLKKYNERIFYDLERIINGNSRNYYPPSRKSRQYCIECFGYGWIINEEFKHCKESDLQLTKDGYYLVSYKNYTIEGLFKNKSPYGNCKMDYQNGYIYYGPLNDLKKNGEGLLLNTKDHSSRYGIWSNDRLIKNK